MKSVSIVITSCKRFDLLERTLRSLLRDRSYPVSRILIVEDSDDRRVYDVAGLFPDAAIDVILNGEQLGQLRSIDKAYQAVTTDYVFHCEDDWEFGGAQVLAASVAILDAEPECLMVMARTEADMPVYVRSLREHVVLALGTAVFYRLVPPSLHHHWYTFSLNPGLRRMKDYHLLPSGYAPLVYESAISVAYKKLGFSMAWLSDGQVVHIGDERGILKAASAAAPATRLAIWYHSLGRKIPHYGRLVRNLLQGR